MNDPRLGFWEQRMNDYRHMSRIYGRKDDKSKALWYDKQADYYEEMILYNNLHEPQF